MVKICPMCRSSRVDVWLGRGSGNMYKCLDCNYQGALIVDVDEENFKSVKENRKK